MLTKEMISANVQGLTEEQVTALTTLSENDEKQSFTARFAEIHNEIDAKVADATGVKRESNEKSSDYMTRALGLFAAQFADAKTAKSYADEIASLKDANEKLKASASADESEKVKALTAELNNTKSQYNDLNVKYGEAQKEYEQKLNEYKLQSFIEGTVSKFSFKEGNPEMIALAKKAAISAVMGKNPTFDGDTVIFKDTNGATLNNTANMLKPFTAEELLKAEFERYGILREKKVVNGTGGKQDVDQLSLSGYKTQSQALEYIEKELQGKGLVRGSNEYQKALNEFWINNKIQNLPRV